MVLDPGDCAEQTPNCLKNGLAMACLPALSCTVTTHPWLQGTLIISLGLGWRHHDHVGRHATLSPRTLSIDTLGDSSKFLQPPPSLVRARPQPKSASSNALFDCQNPRACKTVRPQETLYNGLATISQSPENIHEGLLV